MAVLTEIETQTIKSSFVEVESFFKKKVNLVKLEHSCDLTHALANKTRMKILNFILSKGRTTVNPIYDKLGLEQSVTSQHLSVLRSSGVIKSEKVGKYVYIEIANEDLLFRVQQALNNYFKGN